MGISKQFGASFAISTLLLLTAGHFSSAVQFSDGATAFTRPPTLVKAVTTNSDVYSYATYYFTVAVPPDAGEPLYRLTIKQTEGFDRDLRYNLKRSYAFEGESYRKKQNRAIAIADIQYDSKQNQITVLFDPPIPPGQTFTLGLEPYYNPSTSGVYLFEVTAFPPGEKPRGQFLGFGRLTFYRGSGWGLFR
jgi:hypothetical protein